MRSIVAMNSAGRVTLPAETRRALGLDGESFFEVVVEKGVVVLRPGAIVPRDQLRPAASEGTRR